LVGRRQGRVPSGDEQKQYWRTGRRATTGQPGSGKSCSAGNLERFRFGTILLAIGAAGRDELLNSAEEFTRSSACGWRLRPLGRPFRPWTRWRCRGAIRELAAPFDWFLRRRATFDFFRPDEEYDDDFKDFLVRRLPERRWPQPCQYIRSPAGNRLGQEEADNSKFMPSDGESYVGPTCRRGASCWNEAICGRIIGTDSKKQLRK